MIRKLDRVANQIQENLAQPPGVSQNHFRHFRRHVAQQLQPLLAGCWREGLQRLFHAVSQVEVDCLQVNFSRLNLREIKDVIDDREK
jgi:hypothetical protein